MSNSFNLNTFLQEYKTYGDRKYTPAENGEAAMLQREMDNAAKAVSENSFLQLTLREKLFELGIGDKVMNKLGEIAMKPVTDIVNPFLKYLNDNEIVFDTDAYNSAMQSYAKQTFFSRQALAEESQKDPVGQKFVMNM